MADLVHSPPTRARDWPRRLGLPALGIAVALAFGLVAARQWPQLLDLLDYPYQIDYGEGVVVGQAARLEHGLELYPASDLDGPGFVGANYPPLYYLAVALAPELPTNVFQEARLLSFAGYLLTALLAGLLAGRLARWRPAGLVAAAAVLALPPAREWGVFAKPDLPALAASTAGLLAVVLARPGRAPWAAPLFALALLTKQTAVAAPLAAGLWLLLTPGRRREALALGGLTAALVLGPLVLLELGPQAVFWHLVVANARGWVWDRFDDIGLTFLEIYRPLLPVAALVAPLAWRQRRLAPLALYLPLALLTLLAAGLPGSSRNYALEAGVALSIAGAVGLGWLARQPRRWPALAALGCAALLGAQAVGLWQLPERSYGRRPPTAEATSRFGVMLNFLRTEADGPVLSENVGLLVQAGLPIEYYDPSLMYKLAIAGAWDQQPLLEQIAARHFAYILTEANLETSPERAGRWTPEMIAAIHQHYRVLYRDILVIYAPRDEQG
jgi:4-amino-4-deoxy-L-arabinose transferase-like glycosyltransferase